MSVLDYLNIVLSSKDTPTSISMINTKFIMDKTVRTSDLPVYFILGSTRLIQWTLSLYIYSYTCIHSYIYIYML